MKPKTLFRGAFNFNRSVRIEYAYANSCRQAWLIICRRLAKKDGVDPRMVMGLFDGSRDNHSITIETEFTEA
jgi:hypothetical protein